MLLRWLSALVALVTGALLVLRVRLDPETPLWAPRMLPEAKRAAELYAGGRRFEGKVAVVTGGASGMGWFISEALAHVGYTVVVVGRNPEEGESAVEAIQRTNPQAKVVYMRGDLARLQTLAYVAHQINLKHGVVDLLVLNAGMLAHTYVLTEDHIELSWQVNHVAGQMFILELLPSLLSSQQARVVLVSSSGHYQFDWASWGSRDFNVTAYPMPEESYNPVIAYGAAKAANILTARELSRQFGRSGLLAFSVHPGFVSTAFAVPRDSDVAQSSQFVKWFLLNVVAPSTRMFWKLVPTILSSSQGAGVVLYPCLSEHANKSVNGEYFSVGPVQRPSSQATSNLTTAKALWDRTEAAIIHRRNARPRPRA